jgi:iron complex outermembrane receptor protein
MTLKTTQLRDAIKFAIAVGATAAVGTTVAFAQDAAPAQEEATTLDRVQVTGSRIKRADIETSQPVFTLNREEIQAQGLTSVGDVIQNITSNGATLNSTFNNGGNGETRVSLRNLGSNRTLVLVNGRRWVGGTGLGGAVDLNTIPTAAVERIEVLKDGASSIYGSDAIAGVVNVILRTNFDGAEANAYFGQFDEGDGTRQAYDFTVGSSGDRWSAMFGVGYVKEDPVWAGDREISAVPLFGSSPGYRGSFGTPNGNFSIITTIPYDPNEEGCPATRPASGTCTQWQLPSGEYGIFTPDSTDPRGYREYLGTPDNWNFAPFNYLVTPQERISLFANGSLNITDDVSFQATAQYNERISEQLLAPTPLFNFQDFAGISADSIYNPYGREVNAYGRRMVETGFRSFNQDVNTWAFDGAFEGAFEIGDRFFDWEAGMNYGRNDQTDRTYGLLQLSRIVNATGPSFIENGTAFCGTPDDPTTAVNERNVIDGCVPLNLLGGAGTITPEMAAYITFTAHDTFGYEQQTYFANMGGELFDLPGGALAFSVGVESRKESGFDQPDALINSGDTSGNARTATSGGYSVDEAYLELAIPLLSDMPGADLLEFSIASRYSDYDTFGDTTNSKFGFKWKPVEDLLVRGNWAEGFRAPSISELFSGQADSFPSISDPCAGTINGQPNTNIPAGCAGIPQYNQPNSQVRITVGGNPNLGAETSTSKTLGFVYSPSWLPGFDVAIDWWNIEIENAITTLGGQTILDLCYRGGIPSACGLVERAPSGTITDLLAVPANVGFLESEGYDLTVGYRLPENSWGRFSFVWDTSYMTKAVVDSDADGFISEDPVAGDGGNLVGEYYGTTGSYWRVRSNLATRWEMGDWGASWNVRYFSGLDEDCSSLPASQRTLVCSDPTRQTNLSVPTVGGAPAPNGVDARPENRIPSVVYNDLAVFFNAPWNARVTLGVNNAFDRDPPFSASTFANSFDPQYEIPGRFYYMRYTQRF